MKASSNQPNYYQLLHVQNDAPLAIIKASYRALMQTLKQHPDLGGDHQHASLLNQAYTTLRTSSTRAHYDRQLGSEAKIETKQYTPSSICPFCRLSTSSDRHQILEHCINCDSPLKMVNDKQQNEQYQRAMNRIQKVMTLSFYTAWPQPAKQGQMQDLSPYGLRFISTEALAKQQLVKIDTPLLQAIANVSYCHPDDTRYALGVEFITVMFNRDNGHLVSTSV